MSEQFPPPSGHSPTSLEARLRAVGPLRCHDRHPFHKLLHGGGCAPDQVRARVINRYYSQSRIPMKDAAFMSRVEDPRLRRAWRSRIGDHDGNSDQPGGISRWQRLAEGVGLNPDYVASARRVLPATRFAVDAYMRYVRDQPLLQAVAASLTELFAPAIHEERIAGLLNHYAFANPGTISYVQHRLKEALEDVASGLAWVLEDACSPAEEDQAVAALAFWTDVLWSQLDALYGAYVAPGLIPPGAWQPGEGLLQGRGA